MSRPRIYRKILRRSSASARRYARQPRRLWPKLFTKMECRFWGDPLADYLQQMRISKTEFQKRARVFAEWFERRPPIDRSPFAELVPAFCLMGIKNPAEAAQRIAIRLMTGEPIETASPDRFFIATEHGYSEHLEGVPTISGSKVNLRVQVNGVDHRDAGCYSRLEQDIRYMRLLGNPDNVRIEADFPHSTAGKAIRHLCEAGLVHRLKTCKECGAWFYAQFSHRRFCKRGCQQRHYRSSPTWKAKRRKWMRNYRKIAALPNVK